jgi:hypothetical protein
MKRGIAGAIALLLAGWTAAPATSQTTPTKVVVQATGAIVVDGKTTRLLLDLKGTLGPGAGSLTLGTGVARGRLFFTRGSLKVRASLTRSAPDYVGLRTITGTAKILSGSGSFGHPRGTISITGTQAASGRIKLTLSGTAQLPPSAPGSGRGH